MSADVLPNVEPTSFEFVDGNLYYLPPEGGQYRITQAIIVANGTRDLCIASKGPRANDVNVAKISETEKDKVLWIPKGDILWLTLDRAYNGSFSMILDLKGDPALAKMLTTILRKFNSCEKGEDFDMYAGGSWV
jgi:hypothetical protein